MKHTFLALGRWLFAGVFALTLWSPAYAADSDTLILLLRDGTPLVDNRVAAWADAADEEGLQLKVLYDSQFVALGTEALKYRGLVLPDQIHVNASEEVIDAVTNYVNAGGKAMLVYDFGALTENGFYAIPKSRLSHLAGVDYVLYDQLLERTVGLGPITGMESRMWSLGVPPGKSMPYGTTPAALAADAAVAVDQATYLASDASDPGGVKDYNHGRQHKMKVGRVGKRELLGLLDTQPSPKALRRGKVRTSLLASMAATPTDTLHGITGYVYGFLTYPSYVTDGVFVGDVVLTSPDFGLVAGINRVGAGEVLFVNTPLTYLKGQTDGMLMHGFLRYFAADMLAMPVMAKQPKAKGGMVLNWHVDDAEAIDAIALLNNYRVWNEGPFSMHFTAGPDVDTFGDGLGMDLLNNPTAQKWMKNLLKKGHQIASHGGWMHNYYGINANEGNADVFLPYLIWNRDAVVSVIGRPLTEYSPPEGNNPSWALDWLENEGVVGYYFGGHTGMSFTRNYQNGQLTNAGMWAFPVTPYGDIATFEEFQQRGTPAAEILGWYNKLMDFSVTSRSSNLVYMHPPGATAYPDVVVGMLNRGKAYARLGSFEWYTMTDLARFAQRHLETEWGTTEAADRTVTFNAAHPTNLADMSWLLPASAYAQPRITLGTASVLKEGNDWVVRVKSGKSVRFTAKRL